MIQRGLQQSIDYSFSGYACHDLDLPCHKSSGSCVKPDMLQSLWQLVDHDSQILLDDVVTQKYR